MSGVEAYCNQGLRKRLIVGDEPEWLKRHRRRGYIVACVLSSPPWMTRKAFRSLRAEADLKTLVTGVPHVLGHIVPVTNALVCGLTVPWNMHVIDTHRNMRDSNNLHATFQTCMFLEPEQLGLFT